MNIRFSEITTYKLRQPSGIHSVLTSEIFLYQKNKENEVLHMVLLVTGAEMCSFSNGRHIGFLYLPTTR